LSKVRILLTFFSILMFVQGLQARRLEPGDTIDLMNQIRREKFDTILIHRWINMIKMQTLKKPKYFSIYMPKEKEWFSQGYLRWVPSGRGI